MLASDITQSGATLYDLLETEAVDRLERARALRFLDQAASTSGHLLGLDYDAGVDNVVM